MQFLVSGLTLLTVGGLLLTDTPRVLLSRLLTAPASPSQPIFYYAALVVVALGVVVATGGVLGCWAADMNSLGFLVTYLVAVVLLLLGECCVGVLVGVCPQYLGVSFSRDQLVDNLQRNYGTSGKDQFTAAVDLLQTKMECCGMSDASDYESSWWYLRGLGQRNLVVPRSCCFLSNTVDPEAFLDPRPVNISICQSEEKSTFNAARHTQGCSDKLEDWLRQHTAVFLASSLALGLVELSVLLSALLVCVKMPRKNKNSDDAQITSTMSSSS